MSELENMATEELEEEEIQERPPFVVDDDAKAEWCLKMIKQKKEEIDKWRDHYATELKRRTDKLEADIVWFEGCLKGFFFQQDQEGLTRETKTQTSYNLPHGKLVMKRQTPEIVRDDDAIVEWCEKNAPEYVKVKKSPDWAGLKKTLVVDGDKMVTEDAEIVPGITLTARPDVFTVEVK